MKRSSSLFAGLLVLSAVSAQSLPGHDSPATGAASPKNALLPSHPKHPANAPAFGHLSLAFEPNQGQAAHNVRFLTHGAGGTLSLVSSEAVFTLPSSRSIRHKGANGKLSGSRPNAKRSEPTTLRMQLVGADPRASALKEQPLAGRVNYFTSHDPSQWHTDIPTFGKVGFHSVYPGVDVVYYGNQQHLEYDFVVAPHADPKRIQFHFAGAQGVHLNAAGDLVVRTQGRELKWQKPLVYQQDKAGKRTVTAHFRLKQLTNGQTGVQFAVGKYDPTRSLIIDPVLIYSSRLESTLSPHAVIALDSAGSAYVAGTTDDNTATGRTYVFKLNPTGTALVYSTYLGPTDFGEPAIAVDSSGSAYIAVNGTTTFPTTAGAYKTQQSDGSNLAVAKLNPAGTALVYSTFIGKNREASSSDGSTFDSVLNSGIGIAVDSSGNAYVTGSAGSGFPTTTGAFQTATHAATSVNAFVTKLNPSGSDLVYSTYLGGSVDLGSTMGDAGRGIAVDAGGSAYIAGSTASTDFPTTAGAFQRTNKARAGGGYAAFVTKLNPTGTALAYSTLLGGTNREIGYAIAIDSSGDAYVTGEADSSDFPTTAGAYQTSLPFSGSFVTKLDPTGSSLIYSTQLGPGAIAFGIALDSTGSAYVTGTVRGGSFPTTVGAYQKTEHDTIQAFVTKLNITGSALVYSTYLGGYDAPRDEFLDGDEGDAIAVDGNGNIYVSGVASTDDFPTTSDAFQSPWGLTFVTKLAPVNIFPDVNSDGFSDLFIQNSSTGQVASWFMKGAQWNNGAYYSQTPLSEYALVGAGDFNGIGETTLVFQSATTNKIVFWFTGRTNDSLTPTNITGAAFVTGVPDPGWKVVGVGDFNEDGRSDLVLQNQTTGQVNVWFMKNNTVQGGTSLPFVPAAGWQVVGVGDFNKDGLSDLVFQNQSTGQIALWYLNGTSYLGGTVLAAVPAADWKVVGVGDYNSDGSADLLFQNQTTNQAVVWYLQNGVYAGGDLLSLAPPAGWKIVGPR